MKLKYNIFILILASACSAQAVSFHDFYYGNEARGIKSNKEMVDERVATGKLNLQCRDLTDLIDFDEMHIPALISLTELYLISNHLKTIPASLGDLVHLREIHLYHNELTTLPDTIGNLKNLRNLWLQDNKLTSIPNSIGKLKNLKVLDLENNRLESLPASVANLRGLDTLYLNGNPIELGTEQLKAKYHIRDNVRLYFKTKKQEAAEHKLFAAIKNHDEPVALEQIDALKSGKIKDGKGNKINIANLRDRNGNDLLHVALERASLPVSQKPDIQDIYAKIINSVLACSPECADLMLIPANTQKQKEIGDLLATFNPEDPIRGVIDSHLKSAEAKHTEKKESEEKECRQTEAAILSRPITISFEEYYHTHKKEVNDAVQEGILDLANRKLSDLTGLENVPNIKQLDQLFLSRNQLTEIPAIISKMADLTVLDLDYNLITEIPGFIGNMKHLSHLFLASNQITSVPENIGNLNLEMLYLFNNPIPLNEAQLIARLHLKPRTDLVFRSAEQERVIQQLFNAVGAGDAVTVKNILARINAQEVRGTMNSRLDIHTIRDATGNNLLHAAVQSVSRQIGVIDKRLADAKSEDAKKALVQQKDEIYDRYMKVIEAILSCGEECVQRMLFTPNAEGTQVVDEIFQKLGFNNPIFEALSLAGEANKKPE